MAVWYRGWSAKYSHTNEAMQFGAQYLYQGHFDMLTLGVTGPPVRRQPTQSLGLVIMFIKLFGNRIYECSGHIIGWGVVGVALP